MLEELHVRDLALIEEVWLEFGPGMTALTGETGAGKTALLGALQLLLGERGDAGSVRSGSPETMVEGRFAVGGAEIIARRRMSADGRSKCTLDGEMATVGALADRIGPLVDLHGQHDHQALLSPGTHSAYLDRRAGGAGEEALTGYRSARADEKTARAARDELARSLTDAARDADYLRFVAEEIGRVDPQPGEDVALEARVPALQHGERLAEAADEAAELLRGDSGALDSLAQASVVLGKVADIDPALDELAARLGEAYAIADDASSGIRAYRDGVEHDSAALDAVLGRLTVLSGLAKKYGPRLEDVIATRDRAEAAIAAQDAGEERTAAVERELEEARLRLICAAERLDAVRREAAPLFVSELGAAVADLCMDGARFEVAFTPLEYENWTADGAQRTEFLYAAAPGQPARPLAKIASGGELSRVMLALKGVLGEADTVGTLVFDEVDAGLGGTAARSVGRRLAQLARTHQVIVVTHLAQVAAYADAHLVVSKSVTGESAATQVVAVTGETRTAEIARMLSGNDSETGLAHARELLGEAGESGLGLDRPRHQRGG